MENTTENKAKFFAQYWGQEIVIFPFNEQIYPMVGIVNEVDRCYLKLKPLSSITDEDAKQLAIILGMNEKNSVDLNVYGRKKYGGVQIKFTRGIWLYSSCLSNDGHAFNGYYERYGSQHFNPLTIEASDFLRSKGYAVSWMGVSVQKQIEYGWIKLQDHE